MLPLGGSDALLSRFTIDYTGAVFGRLEGQLSTNFWPKLGALARAPCAGGVPVPGGEPASPSCRAVPGHPAAGPRLGSHKTWRSVTLERRRPKRRALK